MNLESGLDGSFEFEEEIIGPSNEISKKDSALKKKKMKLVKKLANTYQNLAHKSLVACKALDLCEQKVTPSFEIVEFGTMQDYLAKNGPLSPNKVVEIIR
jgi:hypothetical protein